MLLIMPIHSWVVLQYPSLAVIQLANTTAVIKGTLVEYYAAALLNKSTYI